MTKREPDQIRLAKTEQEVMREVWMMGPPITVARLLEIFAARRGWKISTLSTILDRLVAKNFLSKVMGGKANLYTPLISERDYKERETRAFLESVHQGSVSSFVAALVNNNKITKEELADIRACLLDKAGDGK